MKTKGGGKRKGSGFERQLAKDIVKAFKSFGITQRDCWRSINSGAHPIAAGDLEMSEKLAKLFPYCVEAKFHKRIDWKNFLFFDVKNRELDWYKQAYENAKKSPSLCPILVMKENFGQTYVMICDDTAELAANRWLIEWKIFLASAVKNAKEKNVA